MPILRLTPMLYTSDLPETIDFYVQKLGFNCPVHEPELGWARLQLEGIDLMLSLPNDHLPFEGPAFTGSFYLYTDDVDTLWERLKNKVEVAYPLESFDYGMREFAIYDNNGYILQVGQEV